MKLSLDLKGALLHAFKKELVSFKGYKGYDGATILSLTFKDIECLMDVRMYLKKNGTATSTKVHDPLTLYCIFEESELVYSLK